MFGVPTAFRPSVGILSRDGGMDAHERAEGCGAFVGASHQSRSGVEQRAPGIASLDPLGADPLLRPRHVEGAVHPLHRRQHSQLPETRQIFGAHDLRVLDADPMVLDWYLPQGLLHRVEGHLVAPIADGVNGDVEVGSQ